MKALKWILPIFLGIMLAMPAQSQNSISFTRQVNDGDIMIYYATDTISSDTSLFEVPGSLDYKDWSYSVQMVVDSVSGTAAATAQLQAANNYTSSGAVWSTITSGSQTIDGAGRTEKFWNGANWYETRMRMRIAAGGTKVCVAYIWITFKKP